jgi:hypothetical protein
MKSLKESFCVVALRSPASSASPSPIRSGRSPRRLHLLEADESFLLTKQGVEHGIPALTLLEGVVGDDGERGVRHQASALTGMFGARSLAQAPSLLPAT